MFLKDDSIGKIINLSFVHHPGRKLAIKFEIDTNPPLGSKMVFCGGVEFFTDKLSKLENMLNLK